MGKELMKTTAMVLVKSGWKVAFTTHQNSNSD